jgi:hypothetical protein
MGHHDIAAMTVAGASASGQTRAATDPQPGLAEMSALSIAGISHS